MDDAMRKFLFATLPVLFLFSGCAPAAPRGAAPKPGWSVYSNKTYGYEIQYPKGFDLWPTGPEAEQDGANIRIAISGRQAAFPVLDILVSPRISGSEFAELIAPSADLTVESETVWIGGIQAEERVFYWKSTGEIALARIFLDGVVFHFTAEPGLTVFHTSVWWEIISTFRFPAD
jgi:hypothetical protein